MVEAVLLSMVTILAAWAGYSAAKWSTESSLNLAKASATGVEANRAFQEALTFRVGDAVTFEAWYAARGAKDANGMRVALKFFLPHLRVAFDAWIATKPFTNPNAPPGPQRMPQYKPPGCSVAIARREGGRLIPQRPGAAANCDECIRVSVLLASVLFLVGISTQFPSLRVRSGLITVGVVLLVVAVVQMLLLPGLP